MAGPDISRAPRDLFVITGHFSASDWEDALAGEIRHSQAATDRTARLLHDNVGQDLSAAGLELAVLLLDFKHRVPELADRVANVQNLLDRAMGTVREVSRQNVSLADRAGLRYALEHLSGPAAPSPPAKIELEYPEGLIVPRSAARALYRFAECAVAHAGLSGARTIQIRAVSSTLGWILEVLYDVTSPTSSEDYPVDHRRSLVRLQYQAIRSGLTVLVYDLPDGGTKLQAAYLPEDESSEAPE